jgi:hypothetical protein
MPDAACPTRDDRHLVFEPPLRRPDFEALAATKPLFEAKTAAR